MKSSSLSQMLAYGLVTAFLMACSEEDPEIQNESPTPEPPAQQTDNSITVEVDFSDSNVGVDLDGDGTVDNDLNAVFQAAEDAIMDYATDVILGSGCDLDGDCTQEEAILAAFQAYLDQALNTGNLTNTINTSIELGALNIIQQLTWTPSLQADANMVWMLDASTTPNASTATPLGNLQGALDAQGLGSVGPDSFVFPIELTITNADEQTTLNFELVLQDATTVLQEHSDQNWSGPSGGAVSSVDLIDIVMDVLEVFAETVPPSYELDLVEIEAAILEATAPLNSLDLDGDGVSESIGVGFYNESVAF